MFIQRFNESDSIKRLLDSVENSEEKQIYPYYFDAAFKEGHGAFICIDSELKKGELKPYKELAITVWIFTDMSNAEYEEYSICDMLSKEVAEEIEGKTFRARALKMTSIIPISPARGYRGKKMVFSATVTD